MSWRTAGCVRCWFNIHCTLCTGFVWVCVLTPVFQSANKENSSLSQHYRPMSVRTELQQQTLSDLYETWNTNKAWLILRWTLLVPKPPRVWFLKPLIPSVSALLPGLSLTHRQINIHSALTRTSSTAIHPFNTSALTEETTLNSQPFCLLQ